MERKLKKLFDYQKFEGNSELQQVIDRVHAKYAVRELDLADLETVSAAGTPELPDQKKGGKNENDA